MGTTEKFDLNRNRRLNNIVANEAKKFIPKNVSGTFDHCKFNFNILYREKSV